MTQRVSQSILPRPIGSSRARQHTLPASAPESMISNATAQEVLETFEGTLQELQQQRDRDGRASGPLRVGRDRLPTEIHAGPTRVLQGGTFGPTRPAPKQVARGVASPPDDQRHERNGSAMHAVLTHHPAQGKSLRSCSRVGADGARSTPGSMTAFAPAEQSRGMVASWSAVTLPVGR
jgi:hypothetical protein